MPKPRKRYQFKFWLDALNPVDFDLGKKLDKLKKSRRFLPTVRNALTLLFSLQERRTDVLFSMFPWIVDELKPKTSSGGDGGGSAFKAQLDRLEQLMLQQKLPNEILMQKHEVVSGGSPKPLASGGIKSMSVPKFDLPSIDLDLDLDDTIEIKKDTAKTGVAENFVSSLMNLGM